MLSINKQLIVAIAKHGLILLVVVFLVSAILFVGSVMQKQRLSIINKQNALEQNLTYAMQQSQQQIKLKEHQPDINRILAFVLNREQIGDFISRLEAEAKTLKANLSIPAITEEQISSQENEETTPLGVFESIRLKVEVRGEPVNLFRFLHRVEHLPYLLKVVSLSWQETANSAGNQSFFMAPGLPPEAPSREKEQTSSSTLIFDIILKVNTTPDAK